MLKLFAGGDVKISNIQFLVLVEKTCGGLQLGWGDDGALGIDLDREGI